MPRSPESCATRPRPGELPAAGDWVAVAARHDEGAGTIHAVLPRRSAIVRKAAGNPTEAQVVGANVDTVFLVTSLNDDLNLRRLERYLATAWESGAQPAILLTKADLCDDPAAAVLDVQAIAYGVPVHAVSTVTGEGIDELGAYLGEGKTIALIGSSGVGKSTLVNRLAGREVLATQEIRESDGRGRHTTSHRELVPLPGGGLVLDTPGMRELQLWESSDGMQEAFDDVEELVDACRFADCGHGVEPDCAVQAALADGSLAPERYESWVKLQRELEHLERKQGGRARGRGAQGPAGVRAQAPHDGLVEMVGPAGQAAGPIRASRSTPRAAAPAARSRRPSCRRPGR